MKFSTFSTFAILFASVQVLAKPTGLNGLPARSDECGVTTTQVRSCFMCPDKEWERCGEPDETGQRTCFCTECKYACFLDLVNKREPEPQPWPEPDYEPKPEYRRVAGYDDAVCPPSTAVVQGCSQCRYGFTNRLACQPGSTGLECRCDVCFNICTFDGPTRREPEPAADIDAPASDTDQCSQLPFVDSCSRCPFGFDADTCKPGSSGPRECTCTRCGNACQDDSQKRRRAPVPPPEDICPAQGSPVQACTLCGAGFDRCDASTGLCQCRFCDGPSSFCKSSPK